MAFLQFRCNYVAGQCYDGAAAMKGKINGLKTLILECNTKALTICL